MAATYTAVIQQDGIWWIGWVKEIPGVNSQAKTRQELLDNLLNCPIFVLALGQIPTNHL